MAPRHTPRHSPWGLNGTKYWGLFIVEYLQPNKFKEKPSFDLIYQVYWFSSLGGASCFHVFPGKGGLSLSARWKKIMFSGKNTIFPDNTRKIMFFQRNFLGKTIFWGRPEKENMAFRAVTCSPVSWPTCSLVPRPTCSPVTWPTGSPVAYSPF